MTEQNPRTEQYIRDELASRQDIINEYTAFLGSCLLDPGIMLETKVTAAMFGASDAGIHGASRMFDILQSQVQARIRVDYSTMYLAIKDKTIMEPATYGDGSNLFRLLEAMNTAVPSSANWRHYERIIVDAWKCRRIDQICRMVESMQGPSITAADKIEQLEKALTEASEINTGYQIVPIKETILPAVSLIEQRYKSRGKLPGIPTGLDALDRHTFGMQPERLWVIGARPSEGKSALMRQIHAYVALTEKQPVGVISMESSITEIAMRNFAAESKIPASKINGGFLAPADFATIQDTAGRLYGLGNAVLYYDKPGLTIQEFESVARRMVRMNGAKVIFGDYLGLIKVPKSKNRFDEVAIATTRCKNLARELKIPIVMLAQLGRDSEGRRPSLKDFQYSSQIEQDGDVVLMLYHQQAEGNVDVRSTLIIGKARDGLTGDVRVKFDKPILTFSEISESGQ